MGDSGPKVEVKKKIVGGQKKEKKKVPNSPKARKRPKEATTVESEEVELGAFKLKPKVDEPWRDPRPMRKKHDGEPLLGEPRPGRRQGRGRGLDVANNDEGFDVYGNSMDDGDLDAMVSSGMLLSSESPKRGPWRSPRGPSRRSIPSNPPQGEPGLRGMSNFGNSCYLNAALQVLFHVPVVHAILTMQLPKVFDSAHSEEEVFDFAENSSADDQEFLAALLEAFQLEWSPVSSGSPVVRPEKIMAVLEKQTSRRFTRSKMADSGEVLDYLWKRFIQMETNDSESFTTLIQRGPLENFRFGPSFRTKTELLSITVQVPSVAVSSLDLPSLIQQALANQQSTVAMHACTPTEFQVKLAPLLIVHLDRALETRSVVGVALATVVSFPTVWEANFAIDNPSFVLRGVISRTSSHYVAKVPSAADSPEWMLIDDEKVHPLRSLQPDGSETVLVYQVVDKTNSRREDPSPVILVEGGDEEGSVSSNTVPWVPDNTRGLRVMHPPSALAGIVQLLVHAAPLRAKVAEFLQRENQVLDLTADEGVRRFAALLMVFFDQWSDDAYYQPGTPVNLSAFDHLLATDGWDNIIEMFVDPIWAVLTDDEEHPMFKLTVTPVAGEDSFGDSETYPFGVEINDECSTQKDGVGLRLSFEECVMTTDKTLVVPELLFIRYKKNLTVGFSPILQLSTDTYSPIGVAYANSEGVFTAEFKHPDGEHLWYQESGGSSPKQIDVPTPQIPAGNSVFLYALTPGV